MMPYRSPYPVPGVIWASLPIPAFLIDREGKLVEVNPAGETFLNASVKALLGVPAFDRIHIDAPMDEALARARSNQSALFINDVDVTSGEKPPVQCNVQVAPMHDNPDILMLLISPRDIADRLGRLANAKSSAKSAIGMAEMLAHEIKNPLAGITGAAQLLSMGLGPEDRELTDLIVEESRRIVKLLEQVEQFGNLRPPDLRAVNIHDALDRARRSALVGFAANMTILEEYDPSLPLRRKDGSGRALPLKIEIIDNGPGIPPEIAQDIFEPFVSGRENGTGLGLALVSKIINDHGGWISVDSVPGRTVFRVSLPRAPKDLAQDVS